MTSPTQPALPPPPFQPPPPPVADTPQTSATAKALRFVGWGFAGVVGIFSLLVAIGLVFGDGSEPLASTEGADVFAVFDSAGDGTDETWFVVVEPGTSVAELEGITQSLLSLPEAQGLRLSAQFFDSSDQLEGYVQLNRALLGDLDPDELADLLRDAGETDIDLITQNTVGFLGWSASTNEHILCPAEVLTCSVDVAVATFPS